MSATGDRLVDAYLERNVPALAPSATRAAVFEAMAGAGVGALPVVSGGRVVGIVSLTDLFRRPGPPEEPVSGVMVRDVVSVAPGATLREAARKMHERRVHRVLVLADGGALVGVLGARDVLRAVAQDRIAAPLSSVMSAPVITAEARDSIGFALDLLSRNRVHGIVVVEYGAPVGVFTQLEALRYQTMPSMVPVEDFMSHDLIELPADTPAHRAAAFAVATRARRIVAMDGARAAGIATSVDLVRLVG